MMEFNIEDVRKLVNEEKIQWRNHILIILSGSLRAPQVPPGIYERKFEASGSLRTPQVPPGTNEHKFDI